MKLFCSQVSLAVLITITLSVSNEATNDFNEMKQIMDKAFAKTLSRLNEDGLLKKLQDAESNNAANNHKKLLTDGSGDILNSGNSGTRKLPVDAHHHKKKVVSMKHGKVHVNGGDTVHHQQESHHHEAEHNVSMQSQHHSHAVDEKHRPFVYFKDLPSVPAENHLGSNNTKPAPFETEDHALEPSKAPKDHSVTLKTRFNQNKLTKKHNKQTIERSNHRKSITHKTHSDVFYDNDKIEKKDHKYSTKNSIGIDEYNVPYTEKAVENRMKKFSHIMNHSKDHPDKDEEILTSSNLVHEFIKDDSYPDEHEIEGNNGVINLSAGYNLNHHTDDATHVPMTNIMPHLNGLDHDNGHSEMLAHQNNIIHHDADETPGIVHNGKRPHFDSAHIDELLNHLQDKDEEPGPFDALNNLLGEDTHQLEDHETQPSEFFHFKNMNRADPTPLPSEHKDIKPSPSPKQFGDILAEILGGLNQFGPTHHPMQEVPLENHVPNPSKYGKRININNVIPTFEGHEAEPHPHTEKDIPSDEANPIVHSTHQNQPPSGMANLFSLLGNLPHIGDETEPLHHNEKKSSSNKKPAAVVSKQRIDTHPLPIVDSSDSDDEDDEDEPLSVGDNNSKAESSQNDKGNGDNEVVTNEFDQPELNNEAENMDQLNRNKQEETLGQPDINERQEGLGQQESVDQPLLNPGNLYNNSLLSGQNNQSLQSEENPSALKFDTESSNVEKQLKKDNKEKQFLNLENTDNTEQNDDDSTNLVDPDQQKINDQDEQEIPIGLLENENMLRNLAGRFRSLV